MQFVTRKSSFRVKGSANRFGSRREHLMFLIRQMSSLFALEQSSVVRNLACLATSLYQEPEASNYTCTMQLLSIERNFWTQLCMQKMQFAVSIRVWLKITSSRTPSKLCFSLIQCNGTNVLGLWTLSNDVLMMERKNMAQRNDGFNICIKSLMCAAPRWRRSLWKLIKLCSQFGIVK